MSADGQGIQIQIEKDAEKLAKLFSRAFDAKVDCASVERLIEKHWTKLSPLAHSVHARICE